MTTAPPPPAVTSVRGRLTPVWAWLRLDMRRRWRSLVVLALLVAVASGTVMAATAGARRGRTAIDRLSARTQPATVAVLPNQPGFSWDPVRRLPGVAALGTFLVTGYQIKDLPNANTMFPFGDTETMRTLERPVVLSGRLADPARADEAVVSPKFVTQFHRGVGKTVTAQLATPAQTDENEAGGGNTTPSGPRPRLRIVGVILSPWFSDSPTAAGGLTTTAAFTAKYHANLFGTHARVFVNALVRLTDGAAGEPAFRRAFAKLTGREDVEFMDLAAQARKQKQATGFESTALLAFALAALVAAVVLLGQAVARYAAVSAADLRVLRTLGLTSRQALVAAAAGPGIVAAAGVVVGALGAVAASPLFPIGTAAYFEPGPGVHADLTVLIGVATLVVVLIVAAAAATAGWAFAAERRTAPPRRSVVATATYRLGLPVPVVVGARFALEPGRGRGAVPVRPALVGAVVGVLGILGALTFRAGVVDAAANPARFGQTYQLGGFIGENGVDFGPPRRLEEAWARDPGVLAVDDASSGVVTIGKAPVTTYTYIPVSGRPLPVVVLSGRMPTAPDEIALAPEAAHNAAAKVGDTVTVAGGARARMRVTGTAFVPSGPHNGYADGAWTTGAGYHRLFPTGFFKFHLTLIALRPGAEVAAVQARLDKLAVGIAGPDAAGAIAPPDPLVEVALVRNMRVLPLALGIFLGLLAIGAAGHALATAARRRRHDLAVLRALGITRGQARLIVVTQATVLAVTGLLFGIPLGVALGRVLWRVVADSTPLAYIPPVAALALVLIAPVALTVGNLLAALPARRAARVRVGAVLRAE